jgi:hypothetical protein
VGGAAEEEEEDVAKERRNCRRAGAGNRLNDRRGDNEAGRRGIAREANKLRKGRVPVALVARRSRENSIICTFLQKSRDVVRF